MERKGDIKFVQSILNNSQPTEKQTSAPDSFGVFPGIVCKNLNFDQLMGKKNSQLISESEVFWSHVVFTFLRM